MDYCESQSRVICALDTFSLYALPLTDSIKPQDYLQSFGLIHKRLILWVRCGNA